MPYIPFTDEQKVLANSVDLEQFLRMRGEKLERVGREHKLIYCDSSGRHDSITIRGSKWFDHKNQTGGGAIKFMQEFYGMDFQTAVQELLGRSISPLSNSPPKADKQEQKTREFKLPEPNSDMHRVYAYLIKQRFISADIITHFAKQSDGNEYIKGCSVGVVDERSELGGCYLGIAQNHLGTRTDILDCCPKAEGMIMLIRSMAPRVIAVDEIGTSEDIHAIEYAMQCGCRLIASVHSLDMDEASKKPILGDLIRRRMFQRYVVLGQDHGPGKIREIYDERGRVLCRN